MKIKWMFAGFLLLVALGFAAILPYAHTVAAEKRRCRDQFPRDLAEFEHRLRSGDLNTIYDNASAALRQAVTDREFVALRDAISGDPQMHLGSLGEYASFGWQAAWVDPSGQPLSDIRFHFWWEDGMHRLHRVPGLLEPRRPRVIE